MCDSFSNPTEQERHAFDALIEVVRKLHPTASTVTPSAADVACFPRVMAEYERLQREEPTAPYGTLLDIAYTKYQPTHRKWDRLSDAERAGWRAAAETFWRLRDDAAGTAGTPAIPLVEEETQP